AARRVPSRFCDARARVLLDRRCVMARDRWTMKGVRGASLRLAGLAGLAWAFAAGGCDSGPSAAEVASACDGYCEKFVAAQCATGFQTDLAACKDQTCVDAEGRSSECRTALKDYYLCLQAQADICADGGCQNQALEVILQCGAG